MLTIPNVQDVEDFPALARPNATDMEIIAAASGGAIGWSSGCVVTEADSPTMAVEVADGAVVIDFTLVEVDGDLVPIAESDGTADRFDLVVANDDGSVEALTGTPAEFPVPPHLPASTAALKLVFVPALTIAIFDEQMIDKRVPVPTPVIPSAGAWSNVFTTADLDRNNDAGALSGKADSVLKFTMAAATKYAVRAHVMWDIFAASDIKVGLIGPASPTKIRVMSSRLVAASAMADIAAITRFHNAYDTSGIVVLVSANGTLHLRFDGVIYNGSNTGDFAVAWSQNIAQADEHTLRLAGSWLEHRVLS